MVGPTSSWSLSETPVEDFVDASKTALTLVVVLDSLTTACMGKYNTSPHGLSRSTRGTAFAWPILKYSSTTSLSSPNLTFARSERSIERNLRTAADRDSPKGFRSGFIGRGTMNRPVSSRLWVFWKWVTTNFSSADMTWLPHHVQEGVVRLLAHSAAIGGCAFFHKVARSEAIQAQPLCPQGRQHLVMGQHLEPSESKQRMLAISATTQVSSTFVVNNVMGRRTETSPGRGAIGLTLLGGLMNG